MEESSESELLSDIENALSSLFNEIERLEFHLVMDSEEDRAGAIFSVNAGAGGVESQDWAEMLLRMYTRWAEEKGYQARLVSILGGEEAGVKNATLIIQGDYAYGYLRAEVGVHRLIRISPFDASAKRHTSFASVDVVPEVSDDVEIEIDENDLRIDVFRSSGAGGQHVNTTDSAVRITHQPTGIVVSCQNERSQHKNRAYGHEAVAWTVVRNEKRSAMRKKKRSTQ